MRTFTRCLLLALATLACVQAAKKGRKNRKSEPKWSPQSMPALNKRYESVHEGRDLTLDCKAHGNPKPTVRWVKDGAEIRSRSNVEMKKFSLNLKSLSRDMSGNYTCVVNNKQGQLEWTFHLDVQAKVWPLELDGPHNVTAVLGSSATLSCRVLNDPQATIRWQKMPAFRSLDDGAPVPEFLPPTLVPQVLTISSVSREDEGEFRCMAGNVHGLKYSSAWLTVVTPTLAPVVHQSSVDRRNRNRHENSNSRETTSAGRMEGDGDRDNGIYYDISTKDLEASFNIEDFYTKKPKHKDQDHRPKKNKKKDKKEKNMAITTSDSADLATSVTMTNAATSSVASSLPTTSSSPAPPTTRTTTMTKTSTAFMSTKPPTTQMFASFPLTTFPEIWNFDVQPNFEYGDTRYKPAQGEGEGGQPGAVDADQTMKGSISSWTIYTIVGAVAGVVLLIGLLAITLTICCRKEDTSVYKSTSV